MANEPDFDIYADLDDAFTQPLDKDIAKEKAAELERLQLQEDLLKKVENLESLNKKLRASNERLNRNLSILTVTVKDEIARKDRYIGELRRELDDLKFRRRKGSTMNFEKLPNAAEVPHVQRVEVMENPVARTAQSSSSDRRKPCDNNKHQNPSQNPLKNRDEKDRRRSRSRNHSKSSEEPIRSHPKRDRSRERSRGRQQSTTKGKDEEQWRGSRSSNHVKPHEEHAKFHLREKSSSRSSNHSRPSRKRSRSKSHEKKNASENGEKRHKHDEPRSKDRSKDKRKDPDLRKLLLKKQTTPLPTSSSKKSNDIKEACNGAATEETKVEVNHPEDVTQNGQAVVDDTSAIAPNPTTNDSLDPSGASNENSLNESQEITKGSKSKRSSKKADEKSCNGAATEEIKVEVPESDDTKAACNQNHLEDVSPNVQPVVDGTSANAPDSTTNDSLEHSGASKENFLNQSQESAKGPKSKRASIQKEVTDDGVVIFTVTKRKSKKKTKETKI